MNSTPVISGNAILDLIPQRPPIVMIDKFWGIDNDCSYTGLTIAADSIFSERGHLNESGLIEHIAQSAAARIGYICKQNNIPVPIGFIGSVDKMKIVSLPKIGDELFTEIRIIQEVQNITLIGAIVKINEIVVAECRMKIVLN